MKPQTPFRMHFFNLRTGLSLHDGLREKHFTTTLLLETASRKITTCNLNAIHTHIPKRLVKTIYFDSRSIFLRLIIHYFAYALITKRLKFSDFSYLQLTRLRYFSGIKTPWVFHPVGGVFRIK